LIIRELRLCKSPFIQSLISGALCRSEYIEGHLLPPTATKIYKRYNITDERIAYQYLFNSFDCLVVSNALACFDDLSDDSLKYEAVWKSNLLGS
jgi:hypothetical protein